MDVEVTADLPAAVFEADIVLCVTPSEHMRSVFGQIAPLLTRDQIVVSATKGLEEPSLLRMSQVIASLTNNPVRCAERAVVCRRGCGWDSDRDCGGVRCAGGGADHPARVQLAHAAALHER